MDMTIIELEQVQATQVEANEAVVRELSELQLAGIGGGCGVDIFH